MACARSGRRCRHGSAAGASASTCSSAAQDVVAQRLEPGPRAHFVGFKLACVHFTSPGVTRSLEPAHRSGCQLQFYPMDWRVKPAMTVGRTRRSTRQAMQLTRRTFALATLGTAASLARPAILRAAEPLTMGYVPANAIHWIGSVVLDKGFSRSRASRRHRRCSNRPRRQSSF